MGKGEKVEIHGFSGEMEAGRVGVRERRCLCAGREGLVCEPAAASPDSKDKPLYGVLVASLSPRERPRDETYGGCLRGMALGSCSREGNQMCT